MAKCGERDHERFSPVSPDQAIQRFLGLSLGGAKSDRTTLAVIDYYRKQDKAFVVDIFTGISANEDETADQVLLALIDELCDDKAPEVKLLATDVPLTLPPSLEGCDDDCQGYESCERPEIRWMRQCFRKMKRENRKLKYFTPYTQRPVDLYFRSKHPDEDLFQDETLGANLAPQAARMHYLKRYLHDMSMIEVWPKLALFYMHKGLKISKKEALAYRNVETGAHIREKILEKLVDRSSLFIYERDRKTLLTNVAAFDSLICAWVGLQYELGKVLKFKGDLPLESGWVQVPEL